MRFRLRLPAIRISSQGGSSTYSPVTTYYMIVVSSIVLVIFGLLMMFSASAVTNLSHGLNPYMAFARSALIIAGSVVVAIIAAWLSPGAWRRFTWPLYLVALVFQVMVFFFGEESGGNRNWIRIPVVNQYIQPSELLKLATCLVLALVLANLGPRVNEWRPVATGVGLPAVASIFAVMLGQDLGTAMVFVAIAMGSLWIAGAPGKWFPIIILGLAGGAAFLVAISQSRVRRVMEMLPGIGAAPDPSNPTQEAQGLWALGSGGLFGLGPGASRAKWNYLQEAHNDYILAIVGEEFGLVGTLSLLITIGVLIWGTLRLSAHAKDPYIRIASGAVACWLAFQALVNTASVTGLGPVIGVPFPLVSHGGSSFLFTATAIGVLLSFARSEAGMVGRGRFDGDTGGRDPRVPPRRRKADKQRPNVR